MTLKLISAQRPTEQTVRQNLRPQIYTSKGSMATARKQNLRAGMGRASAGRCSACASDRHAQAWRTHAMNIYGHTTRRARSGTFFWKNVGMMLLVHHGLVCSWKIEVWTGTGPFWGLQAKVCQQTNPGKIEFKWTPSVHSSGIFKWKPYT